MTAHTLSEIEKTLRTLWMSGKAREDFPGDKNNESRQGIAAGLLDQIDWEGVRLYAGLLNFTRNDLMLNIFPGCAKLIGKEWPQVVDDYFERCPPAHYNFNRAAGRFPEYLANFGKRYTRKFPFIVELSDYEWLELELLERDAEAEPCRHVMPATLAEFEAFRPVVNPVLAIRRYRFHIPGIVDCLANDCRLPEKVDSKPGAVIVYRDPETDQCRFFEASEPAAKIVEAAVDKSNSYKDLAALAASHAVGGNFERCLIEFIELIEKLQSLKLLIGSLPVNM